MASTGTISSSGIGSGLNVSQIVTALMDAEKGTLNSINKSITADSAQISAYGSISSQISSFQSAIRGLATPASIKATTATSSNTTSLTSVSNGTALVGEYKISGVVLATPQVIKSNPAVAYSSLSTSIGSSGSLTILGTTITPSTYTVAGIVEAINGANISGINATITNIGTSGSPDYQIRIANSSGSPATITATGNLSTELPWLSTDATMGSVTINGVTVNRSTNTISDLVPGLTISLLGTSDATITVAQDSSALSTKISDFVNAFNTLDKSLKDISAYDATTKKGAALYGDPVITSLRREIRRIITSTLSADETSSYNRLSQVGVSFKSNGTLSLDGTTLNAAISANFNKVAKLFSGTGVTTDAASLHGFAYQLNTMLTTASGIDGLITNRKSNLQSDVRRLQAKANQEQLRLDALQKMYQKQYTVLDSTMSSLNSMSSYLTNQFNAMSNSSNNQ